VPFTPSKLLVSVCKKAKDLLQLTRKDTVMSCLAVSIQFGERAKNPSPKDSWNIGKHAAVSTMQTSSLEGNALEECTPAQVDAMLR